MIRQSRLRCPVGNLLACVESRNYKWDVLEVVIEVGNDWLERDGTVLFLWSTATTIVFGRNDSDSKWKRLLSNFCWWLLGGKSLSKHGFFDPLKFGGIFFGTPCWLACFLVNHRKEWRTLRDGPTIDWRVSLSWNFGPFLFLAFKSDRQKSLF